MILDGTKLANKILEQIKEEIKTFDRNPHLVALSAGDNKASEKYISMKKEKAVDNGIVFTHLHFEEPTTEKILAKIDELNANDAVDGVMIQLPLPKGIEEEILTKAIAPWKDVDGFHPFNKGMVDTLETELIPPTALGAINLLKEHGVKIEGQNAVVIGKGQIAGWPTAKVLTALGATVTVCDENTKDITEFTKNADIVVTAAGVEELIKPKDVKEGVALVNIGMNYREDGSLVGDFDFEAMKDKASAITPTPGGTGPMTVALLLRNTLICYKLRK